MPRLAEHNHGQTLSTRNRGPWQLIYQEEFETLAEARRRERQIKSWKSHRSIEELITSKKQLARPELPGRSSGSIPTRSTNLLLNNSE
jgi:predicted GIY-YIG superfamily endonuclease